MKAAVYIRMSTEKQEDSPERQRATTGRALNASGYTLHREYIDEARRGWDDKRPGLRQLLADAEARKFDVIVVDECSRLSRNEPVEFFGEVVYPLKRAGVRLHSVAEGGVQDWDNLPGVMLTAVYQDRSSGESKKTAWRVVSNYSKLAAEGRIDLGKPPYGYKRVWREGRPSYVPDAECPQHAQVVRDIFDAYVNRDMSLRDICREMERRGVPTPAGKKAWSQNCVGRILREMKYAGNYVFNRVRQGRFYRLGTDGPEKADGLGTDTGMNPREQWRVIPDSHEPLVEPALFARAQQQLKANRTRTTPGPGRGGFLLSKLVYCGPCGSPMSGHRSKKGGPAFYRCSRAMCTAQNHCHNNLVSEAEVLDGLLLAVEGKLLSPDFLAMCREEARKMYEGQSGAGRAEALRAELAELDRDIQRTRSRMARVEDEEIFDFLTGEVRKWSARRKEVEAELEEAKSPGHAERVEEVLRRLEEQVRNLREAVKGKDPHLLRAAVRALAAWVQVSVERRLVGKVKHRYYLVGGEVRIRTGDEPTENLSPSGPRPCPR